MQSFVLRRRFDITLIAVAAAWVATTLLRVVAPERSLSLVFFFAAITVSAGVGGVWPGILATILSFITYDYFFLVPYHTFIIRGEDIPLMVMFVLVAIFINGMSERLRAATRVADQRFHDLVQGLDVIVWEGNPKTLQFTFVSRRAEDILGYPVRAWTSAEDFRRRILHPDDLESVMALCRTALEMGGDHEADYRVRSAHGREVWLRETVHVSRDETGRPVRMSGLCVDITERKRAAAELASVKDELAALNGITADVSASLELPTVLATLKRHLAGQLGIPAGSLLLMDETDGRFRLEDAWGLAREEAAAIRVVRPDLPSGDDSDPAEAGAMTQLSTGSCLRVEWDRESWPECLAVPLLANGELEGAICLFSPVSPGFSPARATFFAALAGQVGVIVQNARLFEQVRAGREHLHRLSRRLVRIQEAERRAIARELHDEIGQVLTGLKLSMEMALRLPPEAAGPKLREGLALVNELMTHIDALSLDLRPAMLDDFGLAPTLLWHLERVRTTTGLRVHFEHTGLDRRFSQELETTAYRIVQEALTNVARHAGVTEVTVRMWAVHGLLGIQVQDRGRGFDLAAMPYDAMGGGLTGMRERAALVDGRVIVETSPGNGVCLTAELPLADPDAGIENAVKSEDVGKKEPEIG